MSVTFESGSDRMDGVALNISTDGVARGPTARRAARIEVTRATPIRPDPRPDNEALSLQRAENVAAALQRAGVSPELIEVRAAAHGAAAEAGRRVEIAGSTADHGADDAMAGCTPPGCQKI